MTNFFRTIHIVVYLSLLHLWQVRRYPAIMETAAYEITQYTKYRKRDTYLMRIRDLAALGYLEYFTTENGYVKAEISFR